MGQGPAIDPAKAAVALNLADMGYSNTEIANRTGLARPSVHYILSGHGKWGEIAERSVFNEYRQNQKQHLEAASRVLAASCLEQVEKNLDKASAYQAAGIYGLLRTHERLDAGEATVNIAVSSKVELTGLDKFCEMLSQSLISNANPDTKT